MIYVLKILILIYVLFRFAVMTHIISFLWRTFFVCPHSALWTLNPNFVRSAGTIWHHTYNTIPLFFFFFTAPSVIFCGFLYCPIWFAFFPFYPLSFLKLPRSFLTSLALFLLSISSASLRILSFSGVSVYIVVFLAFLPRLVDLRGGAFGSGRTARSLWSSSIAPQD